jgi:sugar phosphate isomerase/epimerase
MTMANVTPLPWLEKFPKHFELMHVKDRDKTKPESTLLGEGTLDLPKILNYARKNTNVKYWVLEQESYGDRTPLDCMRLNLMKIKKDYKFA